jgi:hypothetical protein
MSREGQCAFGLTDFYGTLLCGPALEGTIEVSVEVGEAADGTCLPEYPSTALVIDAEQNAFVRCSVDLDDGRHVYVDIGFPTNAPEFQRDGAYCRGTLEFLDSTGELQRFNVTDFPSCMGQGISYDSTSNHIVATLVMEFGTSEVDPTVVARARISVDSEFPIPLE